MNSSNKILIFLLLPFISVVSLLASTNAIQLITPLSATTQIVDSSGTIWTVVGGVVLANGNPAGYSKSVIELAYVNGMIYQENGDQNWWGWNGSTWIASANPLTASTQSPSGTTIPSATQIVDSNGAVWTVSAGVIYVNGTLAGYSNGVVQLVYSNGVIYQENGSSLWWAWNGTGWVSVCGPVSGSCVSTSTSAPATATATAAAPAIAASAAVAVAALAPKVVYPTVPANLTVLTASPTQLNLSWTASTDSAASIARYNIYRGNTLLSSSTSPWYSDVGLQASTSYTYSISATDSLGNSSGKSTSVTGTTANSVPLAGSKLGVNLDFTNDWGDRSLMFVDLMKIARGFATVKAYWDPTDNPVPVNSAGWPTTDFGVMFMSNGTDPLNRPLTATFPSMFGTYNLSFTGQASVNGAGCCQIQGLTYNAASNTTTAQVVVGPNDSQIALLFTNTNGGVQNLRLLRPGYPTGTSQVFTTQLLNALAPFSTVRFMVPLLTNNSTVTSWSQRTQPGTPTQAGPNGISWEYIIELANVSGKDIWVNIPQGVDLTDPTANNYVTQLANLMKANLNPGIHVYVEYSNELWNGSFQQFQNNLNAAVNEVNSGVDPTLDYDGSNSNQWYWSYRRTAHQVVRISQLFAAVYGQSAINTTIRPVLMSQFVQPYLAEDSLIYITKNFGAPNTFLYGIGGAPYFWPSGNYADLNSLFAALQSGMNQYALPGFVPGQTYTGVVNWSLPVPTYKTLADYYGLKSLAYEGGLSLGDGSGSTPVLNEQSRSDWRNNALVQQELGDWIGCGNDVFVYYSLATPPGDYYGLYEDLTLPTPKSLAAITVANTPLRNYNVCSASLTSSLPVQ
jgi:hypothetical protein